MSRRDMLDSLAAANPVRADSLTDVIDERLRAEIMSRPRAQGRRAPRRLVLAAAGGAVAAGLLTTAVVLWPTDAKPAFAATPPMLTYRPDGKSAAAILRNLAQRAERVPAPPTGRFSYVQLQSYYLDTAIAGKDRASALRIVREERWLAPDGSGRALTVEGAARILHADDAPTMSAVTYEGNREHDERYDPGTLSGVADLASMSNDPRLLADQLANDRTGFGWSDTAPQAPDWYRRVAVVTGIAKQQTVPPALWAAMLRVLATTPGLTSQGTVTDRAGRQAVALSVDTVHGGGRPARVVLMFSPDTGSFLGEEHILTTKIGDGPYDARLRTKIPAVTTYRTVLAAGNVPGDNDRPIGGVK